jgi:hypothetical protein
MTTELAKTRDYLSGQRRNIIARAVLGSLAGAVPVPFLDDLLMDVVIGNGYKTIARAHHIDVEDEAVKVLVHGTASPPALVDMAASGIVYKIAGTAAKRVLVVVASLNRARSAAKNFTRMTLFDHYCAKLHTGLAIDVGTAAALREEITKSIDNTPGGLAFRPFRKGLVGAAKATLRAPLELADLASRGRVRKLLARKTGEDTEIHDPEPVDKLELAMNAALSDKANFLSRAVAAVEVQLSTDANPFLDSALASFDRRWRARMAVGATTK